MKKIIFLPIEIKSRELIPKTLVSMFALKNNFSCFIGNKHGIFRATKHFSPGTYFYKSINHTDLNHIKKIKVLKNNYIVQDEEAGFTHSSIQDINKFITVRSSLKNVELIDKFFTWGKFDHQQWVKRYSKYSHKFKLLGSPRMDLWKKNIINKVYENELKKIRNKYGSKIVLIISSFISSKKDFLDYNRTDQYWFKFRSDKEKRIQLNQRKSDRAFFKNYIKMIDYISKKNPKINFIIRPHPSENILDWFKISKMFNKNVFVSNDYDASPWMQVSKFVIHNSSAAGLQTIGMNKKLITYKPSQFKYNRNFPNKFGILAKNKEKISKIIKGNGNFFTSKSDIKKLKYRLYDLNSNKLIAEKLVKIINKIHKVKSNASLTKIFFLSFLYKFRDLFFEQFIKILRKKKRDDYSIRSSGEKIPGGIRKKELIQVFKAMNNFDKKVKIFQFCNNCFFVYKKN